MFSLNYKKIIATVLMSMLLLGLSNLAVADIKDIKSIESELAAEKAQNSDDLNHLAIIKDLEDTLIQLGNLTKLKQDQDALNNKLKSADTQIINAQNRINELNKPLDLTSFDNLDLEQLSDKIETLNLQTQSLQTELNNISISLVAQKSLPEISQQKLTENLNEIQEINNALASSERKSEINLLNTRLSYLEKDNLFIKLELKSREKLTSLYSTLDSEKKLELEHSQNQLNYLQNRINLKRLEQSKQSLEEAKDSQNTQNYSDTVKAQLAINSELSQKLVDFTSEANELSTRSLQIKKILDGLNQTQRNIDEQISSLEGTLVLSKVIEQQKKRIPSDGLVKDLSNKISHIRVDIFELNEMEDKLVDLNSFISEIELKANTTLNAEEKAQLIDVLTKRKGIITDSVKVLNAALNSALNINLDQKQVLTISNSLESKLEQQSFWVKSNFPIDLEWIASFPVRALKELGKVKDQFDFNNSNIAFTIAGFFVALSLILSGLIHWKTPSINRYLLILSSKVNVLSQDNQLNTIKAIILTFLLSLKSTILFFGILVASIVIMLKNPTDASAWILNMTWYWLLFSFLLQSLSKNGIFHRHFSVSEESSARFRIILKRSFIIIAVFVNSSLLTRVDDIGIADDVIGMVVNISMLLTLVLVFIPLYSKATTSYHNENGKKSNLILKILAFTLPIVAIVLIFLGYYYTALNIIKHLILSFVVLILWVFISEMIYRIIRVASNRMTYRYKIKKLDEQEENQKLEKLEKITSDINRVTKLLVWVGLLAGLYLVVWGDLIAVGSYLDNITLWHQSIVGTNGVEVESITLLNLLSAIVIILVTIGLVKNINGILEVLIFSRVKLSQGSPYTITTLTSYLIVVIGAAWAFSSLGMSWSKLQWLFAALSVGLGFGLQEIFANFISGLIILFERPVRIGDAITIGEYTGTVSKIRIRATTVIDYDRKEVIIPNKAFVTERFTNWALSNNMTRIPINFSFAYESDLPQIKEILLAVAKEAEFVLDDPAPSIYFLGISASTFDYTLYVFVGELSHRYPTIDFIYNRSAELFRTHNIEMAFNQLDVYIKNKEDNPYAMKIVKDSPLQNNLAQDNIEKVEDGEIVVDNELQQKSTATDFKQKP